MRRSDVTRLYAGKTRHTKGKKRHTQVGREKCDDVVLLLKNVKRDLYPSKETYIHQKRPTREPYERDYNERRHSPPE